MLTLKECERKLLLLSDGSTLSGKPGQNFQNTLEKTVGKSGKVAQTQINLKTTGKFGENFSKLRKCSKTNEP